MSARDVSVTELFDELRKANLRAVEAEAKLEKAADLAAKWTGVHTAAGVQVANIPWAEGVDDAYHIAAAELRAALGIDMN